MKKFKRFITEELQKVPGPKYGKLPALKAGEYWSHSGEAEIPLNKIKTIQHTVYRKGVEKYLKKPGKPIRVHEHDGHYYLQDGHHRFVAAHENGDTTIRAEIFRAKK